MQNRIKRVFSLLLALVMVLSLAPMAFAAEDSAAHVAEIGGEQYNTVNDAIAAAQPGQIVKILADAQDVVYDNEGVILDLNGHNLKVSVPEGVTLSAIDSATDDYEGPYGTLTTEGKVATTVKTTGDVKSYVAISENGSYSFHHYYASIAAISLKPADVALGYRAEFRGDEAVKKAVTGYGYELWLNGGAHKQYTKNDALENSSLTLRLQNILSEGNNTLNALGSTATIGGNAFITLNLGGGEVTLYGTEQQTTLRQVIASINANVSSYGEAQLEPVRTMITTYAAWMEGWETDAIFGLGNAPEVDGDLDVEITVDVTAENGVLTEDAVLSSDDITVTVPQGTMLENGTTQLVLTITKKASSDSGIAEEEGYSLLPLDVHIAGISADNTTPIIVGLGEVLPKSLNIGNYELYHVEDGQTVAMTYVSALSELDTHNEFYYNPATGAVTVAVASFSEFTLRSTAAQWTGAADHTWYNADATTLYIYNADQLWSFSQIVGDMAEGIEQDSFTGKTVVLHADIDLNDLDSEDGRVFYPIGYWNSTESYKKVSGGSVSSGFYTFEGTFDGNGHTIANFYHNTWEMFGDYNDGYAGTPNHYRDGMGLFGKVYGGTVKNLTVKNFSSDGEFTTTGTIAAYADCGATFENITIFNCNPRVYNIGNGGIVGCVGWYAHEQGEKKVTFSNITVDNSNKISALWGSWDVACGGLVGQYYPTSGQTEAVDNLGIHMDNCHVTAQIDVNNDVCANYQYYAYRYAGILIGSVGENVTVDGREYPNMDGITAENCTVGFGDWNDYYYCELVANSIASYTHDYQFSRLTQVASVDVNNKTVTTLEGETVAIPAGRVNYVVVSGAHATENATCYHFVDGAVWNHEDAGYETSIDEDGDGNVDLKEDKQHIYLEFNNLVTGYGWGVTSKAVGEMDGVTILDKNTTEKFTTKKNIETTHYTGLTIKLGDLFKQNGALDVQIKDATVQAFVSPVGKDSTVTATYVADTENWLNSTLTFHGKGAAEIIITDYYFCTTAKLSITVENPVVRYWDYNTVSSVDCGDNGVTLPTADAEDGKTFIGWSETEIGKTTDISSMSILESGTVYKPTQAVADLYAVYSYTESGTKTYTLVTDISALSAGDVIVIAASSYNYALGTTQNSNNRKAVAITKSGNTITVGDDVQLLTLEAGTIEGTYAFNTGSGYLYAASSSSNHLKTQTTNNDNGSWKIEISSAGVATVVAQGSNSRNMLKYNKDTTTNLLFSCYESGQQAISLYKEATTAGGAGTYYSTEFIDCQHTNTTTKTVAATCQTEGSVTVICNNCREQVGETEILSIAGHNYVDGTCTVCGNTKAGEWKLVTDLNHLHVGDNVIIVAAEFDVALSTTQNNNNRGQTSIVKDTANNSAEIGDDVQILILENGTVDNSYAFSTGSGYLYAASSSNNYLRTESTLSDNSSWTISVTDGVATVVAQGTNSHNLMQYNATSSLFASYSGAQKDISIYRWAIYCKHTGEYTEVTVDPTCTEAGYSYKVCSTCKTHFDITEGAAATGHSYKEEITTAATCTEDGVKTFTCSACSDSYTEEIAALGHTTDNGTCGICGQTIGGTTEPTVVLEITVGDFNSTSYAANNNTKTEGDYSYTSYQVMNQSSAMQWQKSKGYITIASNDFIKLELKVTAGTYTVTVGGKTVTGTTSNGVTTYDLTGLTGEVKISVGSATGKVEYLKFYK